MTRTGTETDNKNGTGYLPPVPDGDFCRRDGSIRARLWDAAAKQGIPVGCVFELTRRCGFSCGFCYVRDNASAVLPPDVWLSYAKSLREAGCVFLLLTGGEPLLYPGFWDLCRGLRDIGLMITLNSNGYLMDADVSARLRACGILRVNITLYGASNDTYMSVCGVRDGFDRVKGAVDSLISAGVPVRLNATLTRDNVADLDAMAAFGQARGLTVHFNPYLYPPKRSSRPVGVDTFRLPPEQAGRISALTQLAALSPEAGDRVARTYEQAPVVSLDGPALPAKKLAPDCMGGRASCWILSDGRMTGCGILDDVSVPAGPDPVAAFSRLVALTASAGRVSACADCPARPLCQSCDASRACEDLDADSRPVYLCRMYGAFARTMRERGNGERLRGT